MTSIAIISAGRLRRATLLSLAFAAFTSLGLAQAHVDPDPDIFDGTKTKKEQPKDEGKNTTDDWEGPNLIIYDAKEKGSAKGGAGVAGMDRPGMDIGDPNGSGGMGIPLPLPIPLGGMGAGGGQPALPSLQIPTMGGQQASAQNSTAGLPPGGASAAGAAESMGGRPSDVKIGDPSKKIATSAQGKAGNTAAPAEGGEPGAKEAGEDAGGQIPNTASGGTQSGNRGGGVEKGDAMPADM